MSKLTNLKFLFTTIAIVEFLYAILGLFTPPNFVLPLTGWVLNADGQWIVKLLGAALFFQAWIAWNFRKNPLFLIAIPLATYQIIAASVDWIMWISLSNQGIFSNPLAQATVSVSIFLHYLLGSLLIIGIIKKKTSSRHKKEGD